MAKPEDILIAYGQAYSVVRYLVSEYGEASIAELFKEFQDTRDIDEALQLVYGFDQRGLDAEWRQSVGLEPLADPEPEVEEKPEVRPTLTTAPHGCSANVNHRRHGCPPHSRASGQVASHARTYFDG